MNRKNLTAAVLAGLAGVAGIAGTAQAVNINPDGLGQVLLYPYYTTNGENNTLLSVVNTTEDAKAVKVRFLEGENSVEVLDFNLYMSPYDVWTAAIVPQPAGRMDQSCDPDPSDGTDVYCEGPVLQVNIDENTCMVPKFGKLQSFLPFAYKAFGDFEGDGGTQDDARMNEGHFEMIEMGVLDEEGATGQVVADFDPAAWATHTNVGDLWLPADCDALNDAWGTVVDAENNVLVPGDWKQDKALAMLPPSGGLFGGATVVNVYKGFAASYEADAINGWNRSGFIQGSIVSLHTEPGSLVPNLNSGDILTSVVFSDQGIPLSSDLDRSVDAVSYLFMHDSLMNEYVTDKEQFSKTEWVLTFPTKRFYVESTPVLAPFTTPWAVVGDDMYASACETVGLTGLWDREEREEGIEDCDDRDDCVEGRPPIVSPPPPVILPPPPPGAELFQLCYETNVIRFGGPADGASIDPGLPLKTEILGTPKGKYLNFDNTDVFKDQNFKYGWARVELDDYGVAIANGGLEVLSRDPLGDLNGLPVAGFSVNRFSNLYLEAPDGTQVLSTYGTLFSHKATRKMGS